MPFSLPVAHYKARLMQNKLLFLCYENANAASVVNVISLVYLSIRYSQTLCIIALSVSSPPLRLQSNDNDERLQVVKLLAKMFGAKDSELAAQNKPLWQCYLGR